MSFHLPIARTSAVLAVTTIAAVLAVVAACTTPRPPAELTVRDAWIRPALAGQTTAAYLTVAGGAEADRLLSALFTAAEATEVHETVLDGDMVRMVPRPEGLVVPAGGELRLAPRGAHLMLVGLSRPLAEGESVPLTLVFENAGPRTIMADVQVDR